MLHAISQPIGTCFILAFILDHDVMILQCGEKERAVVAFADTSVCFEPPSKFSIDGVTEKVKEILRPIPQLPWPNGLLSCFENPGNLAISPINLWRFSAAFCHVQQGGGAEGAGEEVLGPGEYFNIFWARWIFPYFNISWARWKFSVSQKKHIFSWRKKKEAEWRVFFTVLCSPVASNSTIQNSTCNKYFLKI